MIMQIDVYEGSYFKGLTFDKEDGGALEYRYGKIDYFFQHVPDLSNVSEASESQIHTFAMCRWLQKEPNPGFQGTSCQTDMEVVRSTFEPLDSRCIIPVHCIHSPLVLGPYADNRITVTAMTKNIIF
jgi:hypothetical protein